MPTNERTAAESVPRPAPIGWDSGTRGKNAGHCAGQQAGHAGAADIKTLARQALARIEGRDGARDTERDSGALRCPAHVEGAGHLSERERTAPDSAWWRDLFEERAAIREHEGGASRAEAEAGALADLVARWRALHALPASADGACVQCGKPGPDTPVLAKAGHAWLHRQCWPAMNAKRETQARAAVKAMLGRASAVDTAQEILEIGAQIKPGH